MECSFATALKILQPAKIFLEGPKSPRWKSEKGCKRNFSRQLNNSFSSVDLFLGPVVSSFDFPAKIFGSELENHCEFYFQTTLVLENVTLDTYHAISPPVLKKCHESSKYFRSIPETSIEFNERKLSPERILWNHIVLFWQHYQKFPPKVWSFCWMIKNKQ